MRMKMIADWGGDWLNSEKDYVWTLSKEWSISEKEMNETWEESDWKLSKIMIRQWVRAWPSSE